MYFPENYVSTLNLLETELAIKLCKDTFERQLASALKLTRISAPLFVDPTTGLNDNLSGVERPVSFDVPDLGFNAEIVQSLAKWKRMVLGRYGFAPYTGLYTDMNAIRRDETLDNLHSLYVDQWDWEMVLGIEDRTEQYLISAVNGIYEAIYQTSEVLKEAYPQLKFRPKDTISFISSQTLEDMYPSMTSAERENVYVEQVGAAFVIGIGARLRGGKPHDGRAPDYDDWSMNGDLLIWSPVLNRSVEISSMGIRVDAETMHRQLTTANCLNRAQLPFHRGVLEGALPLTMGGGIGQSRLCMLLLDKAHIGEVQASLWPEAQVAGCEKAGILLL